MATNCCLLFIYARPDRMGLGEIMGVLDMIENINIIKSIKEIEHGYQVCTVFKKPDGDFISFEIRQNRHVDSGLEEDVFWLEDDGDLIPFLLTEYDPVFLWAVSEFVEIDSGLVAYSNLQKDEIEDAIIKYVQDLVFLHKLVSPTGVEPVLSP